MPEYVLLKKVMVTLLKANGKQPTHYMGMIELCIECLEKRLGRKLGMDDFEDVPINASIQERLLGLTGRTP